MSYWLIADNGEDEIRAIESEALKVDAAIIARSSLGAEKMRIDNGVANISVRGVLAQDRSPALDYFKKPQTAYSDIVAQVEQAEASNVREIVFNVDSGGGNVRGMFEAMDAIRTSPLRTTAIVSGSAQSAAYMLASQADRIVASHESDMVGSIGVKVALPDSTEISNSESPNKTSSAQNEDGTYAVQSTLSEIYAMVTPRMADARNTTVENINSKWGKGATITAKSALERGMIDEIKESKTSGRSGKRKGDKMTIDELRAQFPDLYASVLKEGEDSGAAKAKAELLGNAKTHLDLAAQSGAMERAHADIIAGNPVDFAVMGFHTSEQMRQMKINARTGEAPADVPEAGDAQASAHGTIVDPTVEQKEAYKAEGLEVSYE